ncbi:AfsA-related hotdog domain-containing protein [Krasilnikovia sp. MM14-A1004]|uniref:AfsA-related hotdog domain-containing protein n=1 Tax=Krasilnikovia sp. MM14-A1004 TaxID=3373541 RepID=UPI00399C595E
MADRFERFADGEQVYAVSDFTARVVRGAATEFDAGCVVHAGQGIEGPDLDVLRAICTADRTSGIRLAASTGRLWQPVPAATVHKSRAENVLLADLRNPAKERCSARLRIHADNELVLDHHSGKHVQGMVIIEAMRQVCTAQFETSYRPELPRHDYAGLWHRMDLAFESFLFALDADVLAEITDADLSRGTNLRFHARTSVRQNGEVVATAGIEYSMVDRKRVDVLERYRAARAARAHIAGHADR